MARVDLGRPGRTQSSSGSQRAPYRNPLLDAESVAWLDALQGDGADRDRAVDRLHALVLRITRSDLHRRRVRLGIAGPELDDLAHQAAADAVMVILRKVSEFRGDSRFTTWVYKFAILEVAAKLGRHYWRVPRVSLDAEEWERLPARLGSDPAQWAESSELLRAVRRIVTTELTARQRQVFVSIVVNGVPIDALAAKLCSTRNALYKVLFDARRKVRARLVAEGYASPALPDG